MEFKFIEENGNYCIDCSKAVWATNKMNCDYHQAGIFLSDVDFVIESDEHLILVEYKNSRFPGVVKPEEFKPETDKYIDKVARKFYDALHYIKLFGKTKPVQYIYVVEYPSGDSVTRKRLRNKLKAKLPFKLQEHIGNGITLIDKVDVVSIDEWNNNESYGRYPFIRLT